MAKTVKITTDNKISLIDITPFDRLGWYQAIGGGCDHVEIVKTRRMFDMFRIPVLMLVDEDGFFNGQEMNLAASLLYGMKEHGNPILWNVVFAVPSGEEILPPADAKRIWERLRKAFLFLKEDEERGKRGESYGLPYI